MLTPIQQLILELEENRARCHIGSPAYLAYTISIQAATAKLEAERSEIIKAFSRGYIQCESAETYYDNNYKPHD